ncbi:transcriptional regulator with XRE-family HTH domain [Nocardioides zeae]|uniref:Transcriptional regulator with XRE-family HTH domain n=1 Tax=Nocardioides zeae TaxID=1457234 RepID=A0ACC6INK0_9ACTN|nr:helix-turn-helix transcriptional regulator [Nocardioides zeae]MDR6212188.1 transcriptional regulator with XRE-family HTH domain [Nocardioides zeae]
MNVTTAEANAFSKQLTTEIRVLMARRDLTQQELADDLGRAADWLSRRLAGRSRYTVDDVLVIAQALEVEAPELFAAAYANATGR